MWNMMPSMAELIQEAASTIGDREGIVSIPNMTGFYLACMPAALSKNSYRIATIGINEKKYLVFADAPTVGNAEVDCPSSWF